MKKNLYGNCQAEENWFDMLKNVLEDEYFKQSRSIYFVRNRCITICNVDDWCIFSKDNETNDELLKNLSKTLKLTDEEDVKSYLGTSVRKYPNETMSQPAIINKILNILGIFNESKIHNTPENVILKKMKMKMGGNRNGNIIQSLVKWIIFLEHIDLVLSFPFINVQRTA